VTLRTIGPLGNTPHSAIRTGNRDVRTPLPVRSSLMSTNHRRASWAGLLSAVLFLFAACSTPGGQLGTFDPAAPCPAEGQQPGAYPDLEAMLASDYEGRAPDTVDSGRLCSTEALGTLAQAGITQLRFAGATWQTGGTSGLTLAVFEADGLDAEEMLDFYAIPAQSARRTEKLQRTEITVGSAPAERLDVLGSDGTGQTVVTWKAPGESVVRVLLAADLGDSRVADLLATLGSS
jgi:hypothetical protein